MIQGTTRRSARRFAGVRANQITLLASLLACLLHLLLPAMTVKAQCTAGWLPGAGLPGVTGATYAVAALPGGDMIVGGSFNTAGGVLASSIARYNPATGAWSALGSGVSGIVYAVAALPDGDLIVGGSFSTAGGVSASCIARYNPATGVWSALGSGIIGAVYALAVLPGGDVIVGGAFLTAGGLPANYIARYNPATGAWSALGSGSSNRVNALAVLPGGDVVVGGDFTTAGGVSASRIARYNPATGVWSALGAGTNLVVFSLAVLPGGDVIVGGGFSTAGGVSAGSIARYNPSTRVWSALGSGMNGSVYALAVLPGGDVIVGGAFRTAGGMPANSVARYNPATGVWSALGSGTNDWVFAIGVLPSGDVIAGGFFASAGGAPAKGIARCNPATGTWSAMGGAADLPPDFSDALSALMVLPGGDVVAGGIFLNAGGLTARRIARWDGSAFSPLGMGIGANLSYGYVYALTTMPNGDIIAGGYFGSAGSLPANNIARWNGSTWSPLGTGVNNYVYSLITLPNGDLIAGGSFITAGGVTVNGIARWNGSAWTALGTGTAFGNTVYALTTLPNGDLIAGGQFQTLSPGGVRVNNIALWNGSAWSPLSTGLGGGANPTAQSLTTLPNGDLVVGGSFTTAGGVPANNIARWNGSTWSALGTGLVGGTRPAVKSLTTLPNGDLIAGGDFQFTTPGGVRVYNIARWNGSAWSALGTGMTGGIFTSPSVNALATLPNGDLIAGGTFTTAGGNPSAYFARYTFGSPADVAGPGQSLGSDNALTADDIIVYLNWFFASDTRANVAGPGQSTTPDTQFTADDIIVFLNRFFAGC
jgi:hypothetical protein